ncbi:MAG: alpha-amylase family glycosyl hydrolase [Gulosibacter sp.]|uniref:alpha-amylase family glycosyl hydrolase n=1 Tax=Gulosibacter sp. TaxID=2817531 RepID=UPI003F9232A9
MDNERTPEPDWVHHAIWWRLYPLGFVGAVPEPPTGAVLPNEHRLSRILGWLDHVVELGASGIALGPIFASESHGYDTVDHYQLDSRLGEDADFDRLVAEARSRGLRIQLDGVFNHVSRRHIAVESGWLLEIDDHPVPFEGHDILLTLDHNRTEVQEYVIGVMRHWLDRGVDSWRLDAAYAVPPEFWAKVLPEVRRTHPEVWFEAEVIHGDYPEFVTASTADTVTQYELWKAIWSSISDRNFHELAWSLTRHNEMLETFIPATFVGNHDVTRIASQIANARHLEHAIVLLSLLGGTPTVYAGDEFGMRAVKEERFGGDDSIRPEFPASPTELSDREEHILALHRRLLGLRRRHAWLHSATTEVLEVENERLRIRLAAGSDALVATLNLSEESMPIGPGATLEEDDATRATPDTVAPHGWRIESATG